MGTVDGVYAEINKGTELEVRVGAEEGRVDKEAGGNDEGCLVGFDVG